LAQIVAELVDHYVWQDVDHNMYESCSEVAGSLRVIGLFFQFLLNHAAACLIEGKQFDLFADVKLLL